MSSLEFSVVGSFLASSHRIAKLRELAARYKLNADSFADNDARRAFEIVSAADAPSDADILSRKIAEAIGSNAAEKMIADAATNLVDTEASMRQLTERNLREQATDIFNMGWTKYGPSASSGFILDQICEKLRKLSSSFSENDDDIKAMPLSEFKFEGPEEDRPNALFPNGWFRKGHGMFLTSVSGSGKSVLATELCCGWALGREVCGIKPFRPLSIGIFGPEDDAEDVAEFRDSICRGFQKYHGWTEQDVAEACGRVQMLSTQGKMGKDFIDYFRRIQRKYHFDLVVFNPLQSIAGIDLAKNNELTEFFRGGIDTIIKAEETKCGLLIIHHTNKPPSNADKLNFGKGAFAQYIGAGGQEINAWMRGMLLLMPTIEPRVYELSAVKRGGRLGWTNPPGKSYLFPTKIICQEPKENHMLFWRELDANNVPPSLRPKEKLNPAVIAGELAEALQKSARRLTAGELRELARRQFGRKKGDDAYEYLVKNTQEFNVTELKTPNSKVRFYEVGGLPL